MAERIATARALITAASRPVAAGAVIRSGVAAIDAALPGGGFARAALHEVAGDQDAVEHGAAASLFVAGLLGREAAAGGAPTVLWVMQQADLFAPALAGAGLHPDRVVYVEAKKPAAVLIALEDALRHGGLAGVVGEYAGRFTLTASRRLQLAAEATRTPCFLLRRSRRFDDPALAEPCAAATRWRVAPLPSPPPLPDRPDVAGLATRARWRLDLIRCRGAEPGSWMVEAFDAQGRLDLAPRLPDRPAAAGRRHPGRDAARHRAA